MTIKPIHSVLYVKLSMIDPQWLWLESLGYQWYQFSYCNLNLWHRMSRSIPLRVHEQIYRGWLGSCPSGIMMHFECNYLNWPCRESVYLAGIDVILSTMNKLVLKKQNKLQTLTLLGVEHIAQTVTLWALAFYIGNKIWSPQGKPLNIRVMTLQQSYRVRLRFG